MTSRDDVYKAIPVIKCKGACWTTCAHIPAFSRERAAIRRKHGIDISPKANPCPALHKTTHRCTIYGDRPFICRLWGVAEGIECTEGCEVDRVLTDAEARELMAQMEELDGNAKVAATYRLQLVSPDVRGAQAFHVRIAMQRDSERMAEGRLPDGPPSSIERCL